jgi:hypothetical protein
VCRLAPLDLEAAADLKLAITEAATFLMGGDRRAAAREDQEASQMTFSFRITDDAVVVDLYGETDRTFSEEEQELSRAIIEATADVCEIVDGTMRLTKRLGTAAE